MSSAGDFTTLADVKAYLALTVTTDDALLGRLITAASAWIRSYLNRDVNAGAYSETLDGTGTPSIMLPEYPITWVSGITVDGRAVAASAFVFKRRTITLTNGERFTKGVGNVVVDYSAGYDEPPADIAQACTEMVAWRYKGKDRIGQASKTAGGQETVAYQTTDVPASVKTLLQNWRKVVA